MKKKIVHFCWFGGKPIPDITLKYIDSWKKFLPDYEIKKWDETNYNINKIKYTKEAYKSKKYAFVSDYARFDILYNYGGLYFDTDVELIKPINDLIKRGPFMGMESGSINDLIETSKNNDVTKNVAVNPGLVLYAKPHMPFYKKILDIYNNRTFIKTNGEIDATTVVKTITNEILKHNIIKRDNYAFCEGVKIYPQDYFNPLKDNYFSSKAKITENTRSIHHYDASWLSDKEKKWYARNYELKNKDYKKYLKYINKTSTKIKKEIYVNGIGGLIKKIWKKIWRI